MLYKKSPQVYDFRHNKHSNMCRQDCCFDDPFLPPQNKCSFFDCPPPMPTCGYYGYIGNLPPFPPPQDNCPCQSTPRIYWGINFCITQQSNKPKKLDN